MFANVVAACSYFFPHTGSAAVYVAYAKLTLLLFVNSRSCHRGGLGGFRPDSADRLASSSGRTPKRRREGKVEEETGGYGCTDGDGGKCAND